MDILPGDATPTQLSPGLQGSSMCSADKITRTGICTLRSMEWLARGDLLHRTVSATQYSWVIYVGKESERERVWVHAELNRFVVHQKWSQPGKSTKLNKALIYKNNNKGVPFVAHGKWIQLGTRRLRVRSLASLRGLRIGHCHELWWRSQTQLGSGVAVAVV